MPEPIAYVKQKRHDLRQNLSAEWADMVLNRADPRFVIRTLSRVPKDIPAKFRAYIYRALLSAYLRTLFERSTHKYTLTQRHAFNKRVFNCFCGGRES